MRIHTFNSLYLNASCGLVLHGQSNRYVKFPKNKSSIMYDLTHCCRCHKPFKNGDIYIKKHKKHYRYHLHCYEELYL